jgi:hypothetical protein
MASPVPADLDLSPTRSLPAPDQRQFGIAPIGQFTTLFSVIFGFFKWIFFSMFSASGLLPPGGNEVAIQLAQFVGPPYPE